MFAFGAAVSSFSRPLSSRAHLGVVAELLRDSRGGEAYVRHVCVRETLHTGSSSYYAPDTLVALGAEERLLVLCGGVWLAATARRRKHGARDAPYVRHDDGAVETHVVRRPSAHLGTHVARRNPPRIHLLCTRARACAPGLCLSRAALCARGVAAGVAAARPRPGRAGRLVAGDALPHDGARDAA
jgi:hypothetical protein